MGDRDRLWQQQWFWVTLVITVFLFMSLIMNNLYYQKEMYEAHVSEELYQDYNRVFHGLIENEEVIKDVLNTNKLTYHNAYRLERNFSAVGGLVQNYEQIAHEFNRFESWPNLGDVKESTFGVGNFFRSARGEHRQVTADIIDKTLFELKGNMVEKVEFLRELNRVLLKSAVEVGVTGIYQNNDNTFEYDNKLFRLAYEDEHVAEDFWTNYLERVNQNVHDLIYEGALIGGVERYLRED